MPKFRTALKRHHFQLFAKLMLALAILPGISLQTKIQRSSSNIAPAIAAGKVQINHVWLTISGGVTTTIFTTLFLPLIMFEPFPSIPVLYSIDNSDQDNYFSLAWSPSENAEQYTLQESLDPSFAASLTVYHDQGFSWSVPAPGKMPTTYYYRLRAENSWGQSAWGNTQAVTIHPQFVGLALHWDGAGYIRGSSIFDVGDHETLTLDSLTDADTIRVSGVQTYDPNPEGWPASSWFWYYSVSTGQFKSSSVPDDPSWKWGDGWRLAYGSQFANGQTVPINGQNFTVTGPHQGTTAFGTATTYWEFVNQSDFVMWDGGGAWTEHVHPGDAVLRYEAGNLGYELYSNVVRRLYYQGNQQPDTVQYIINLTTCNVCQGTTVSAGASGDVGSGAAAMPAPSIPDRASSPKSSNIQLRQPWS